MDTKSKNSKRRLAAFFLVLAIICFGAVGVITGYIPANGYLKNMTGPRAMITTSVCDHYAYRQRCRDIEYLLSSMDYSSPTIVQQNVNTLDFYVKVLFRNGAYLEPLTVENNVTPEETSLYTVKSGYSGWRYISEKPFQSNTEHPLISITYGLSQDEYLSYSEALEVQRWNMWVMFAADVALIIAGVVFSLLYIERTSAAFRDAEALPKRFSIFYEISLAAAGLAVVAAGMLMLGSDSLYLLPIAEYSEIGKGVYMAICGAATAAAGLSIVYIFTCASVRSARKQGLNGSLIYRLWGVVFKAIKWLGGYAKIFFRFLGELLTGRLFKGTAAKRLLWLDLLFIILSLLNVLWFILFLESFFVVFIIACEIIITALFLYGRYLILRDGAVLENNIKKVYETPSAELSALPEKSVYYNSNESLRMLSAQYAKSLDETVKAERMKIDLVTNVSHDLKTPLTSIISYVELLSKEELPAAASDYVKILKAKSERL
ncbi:MAG: histidine kinase dimerization/phospho-acceptor domain-containing protein, partial [Oscillospiraceae bacterium]